MRPSPTPLPECRPLPPEAVAAAAAPSLEYPETSDEPSTGERDFAAHITKTSGGPHNPLLIRRDHVDFLHSGWTRTREAILESMQRTFQPANRIERFCDCGSGCNVYVRRFESGEVIARARGSSCRDRLCLTCGRIRSFLWKRAAAAAFDNTKKVSFITLTIGGNDNEPLTSKLNRLYAGWRALRPLLTKAGKLRGGVAFLEVKHTGRRWHPHLHLLADADYIDCGRLSSMWRAITGDSFIVDIRRVHERSHALRYVAKYASKPLNASFARSPDLLDEFLVAIKGRRLVAAFGRFHGKKLSINEDQGDTDESLDPLPEWECVGPLSRILDRAQAGDVEAAFILRALARAIRWTDTDSS